MSESRIEQLWEQSKTVLADCALPNGAIVAANSDLQMYPPSGENYRYVWARDSAFQIVAAHTLEMPRAPDMRAAYLGWLMERAQGFSATGLIVKRYATNGNLDWRYGTEYQPDQAGALLWALAETQGAPDQMTHDSMRLLANGLVSQWDGKNFRTPTQDLWENRLTQPEQEDVFTYSLAAVAHGLGRAIKHLRGKVGEVDVWDQARDEMHAVLESDHGGVHFLRKIYASPTDDGDNTLDASLNALIFPFSDFSSASLPKRTETITAITRELCRLPNGVARYEGDTYDGIVRPGGGEATAGRWPLLTFWHTIALHEIGQVSAAKELYGATIDHLDELYESRALPNNLIPEQLFSDERQGKGMLPLAWSHAMFVLATKKLAVL